MSAELANETSKLPLVCQRLPIKATVAKPHQYEKSFAVEYPHSAAAESCASLTDAKVLQEMSLRRSPI